MKDVRNAFISTVIAFVAALLLNSAAQLLTQDIGAIRIGPSQKVNAQYYATVTVTNYTSAPLDDIILTIPATVNITDTIASGPAQISYVPDSIGTTNVRRVSISAIDANQVIELLIPVSDLSETELIHPINARQKRLTIEPSVDIRNRWETLLPNAAIYSVIYAVIFFLFQLWTERRVNEALERQREHFKIENARLSVEQDRRTAEVEQLERQLKVNDVQTAENQLNLDRTKKGLRAVQILLLARLSDYAKELDFWRDTIRKILYTQTGDSNAGEIVIRQVTECLKTYTTLGRANVDFETIKVLAAMFPRDENASNETTKS